MAIQTAGSTAALSSLEINASNSVGALGLSRPLISLCENFQNLTTLKFKSSADKVLIVLVDILQHLPSLNRLDVESFEIKPEKSAQVFLQRVSNVQPTINRLQHLKLSLDILTGRNSKQKANHLFTFALAWSPGLKTLELEAQNVRANGMINLDCRRNSRLQYIKLNMPQCEYYTFGHAFGGNRWRRTLKEEIYETDFIPQQFYVNLAWDPTKNMEVELLGCQQNTHSFFNQTCT